MDEKVVINLIKKQCSKYGNPIVNEIADLNNDSFKVLISCLLSLRTKDITTAKASKRLFIKADTPYKLVKLSDKEIEKLIYPVGFYKRKSKNLKEVCKHLIENHNGQVPNKEKDLLKIKGVGRKTMNICLTYAFNNEEGLAVDTHVNRISNRLGWVKTKTPEETELALKEKLDKKYWKDINNVFVQFGQNICKPVSPYCSKCSVNKYCQKINVNKSR